LHFKFVLLITFRAPSKECELFTHESHLRHNTSVILKASFRKFIPYFGDPNFIWQIYGRSWHLLITTPVSR